MQKPQLLPICLSLLAAVIGAFAQLFFKRGALAMTTSPLWKNFSLFIGLSFFTLVLVLFITAFRMGGRVFVIYPVYATTYIWVGLLGVYLEKEPFSLLQVGGVALIMSGVALIGLGTTT